MFVLKSKLDEALKQRDEAAGVAAQLHTEKATLLLFTGLLLKKVGGTATFPLKELQEADGQFGMEQAEDGAVTLEIVVAREGRDEAVVGEIGPGGIVS